MAHIEMPTSAIVALPPLTEAIEASRTEHVHWRDCRSLVSWNTVLGGLCALALWGLVWDGHWDAALAILLSFYLHEAGHLLAAVRLGIRVVMSPLFTVGGARVFVSHPPYDRGAGLLFYLAGPLAGAIFASGVVVYGAVTRDTSLLQAGVVAVLINLGSLLPSQSSTVTSDGMRIAHLLRDRGGTWQSAWPRRRLRWVSYVVGGMVGLGLDGVALAHPPGVVRTAVRVAVIVAAVTAATAAARRTTRWACAPDRPKAARYLALATCTWVQSPSSFWTPQAVPLALLALARACGLPGLALLRQCARSWTRSYPDLAGTACAYGYDLLGSPAEREHWLQGQAAAPLTEHAILSILTNLAALGYREEGARWASARIARVPVGPLRAPTEIWLATVWLRCGRNEEAVAAARTAVAAAPLHAPGYTVLGLALMATGKPEAAEAAFRRALDIEDMLGRRLHVCRALAAQGRYDEAVRDAKAALSVWEAFRSAGKAEWAALVAEMRHWVVSGRWSRSKQTRRDDRRRIVRLARPTVRRRIRRHGPS